MATYLPLAEWKSAPHVILVNYSAVAESPGSFKVSIQSQETGEIGRSLEDDARRTRVLLSGEIMSVDEAKSRAEQLAAEEGIEHIVMWDTTKPPQPLRQFGRSRNRQKQ
jgi:hypothetical protein